MVNGAERLGRYLRADEMHTAFNFGFLKAAWGPGLRAVVDETRAALAPVGAPATWVLSSHDETRLVTRYGRRETGARHIADAQGSASDLLLGTRRARAAVLLMLALPGGAYIYQGDELGLPDVEDIPDASVAGPDLGALRSHRPRPGRLPGAVAVERSAPPFGFSAAGVTTWLPQPESWARADRRGAATGLASRCSRSTGPRCSAATSSRPSTAMSSAGGTPPLRVLDFERGDGLRCVVNFGPGDLAVQPGWDVVLASGGLVDGLLPPDSAAWLRAT